MADQNHGAGVILQQRFEQFEGVDVEIVGRLVENEQVGGPREQAREQQAVAFAARQRRHLGVGALGREQEVDEIAHHVLLVVADLNPLGAGADGIRERGFVVELVTKLVEVGDLEFGAALDGAAAGFEFTEDQFDDGRFARAIRADQAELVATQQAQVQALDDVAVAKRLCHIGKLGHHLARTRRIIDREVDLARTLAPRGALVAQGFEAQHAPFVAGTARLHPFADPHFFLRQELVELGIDHAVHFNLLGLARLVRGVVAGEGEQAATIQLDHTRRDTIEKRAVVGHEQHRALVFDQRVFEPGDRFDIEMVGRLVQNQQLRLADQRTRQGNAFFHAARCRADACLRCQAQTLQHHFDAMRGAPGVRQGERVFEFTLALHAGLVMQAAGDQGFVLVDQRVLFGQARSDCRVDRVVSVELGLLIDYRHAQAGLQNDAAIVQLGLPGDHAQH